MIVHPQQPIRRRLRRFDISIGYRKSTIGYWGCCRSYSSIHIKQCRCFYNTKIVEESEICYAYFVGYFGNYGPT